MGVEFRHYLVVNDALWRPQADTATRVGQVMRDWSLGDRPRDVIDLQSGESLGFIPSVVSKPGRGIAIVYDWVHGAAAANLAGASYYGDCPAEDRYIREITLIIGDDYRVQMLADDSIYFEEMEPPIDSKGHRLEPIEEEHIGLSFYSESFLGTDIVSPPVLRACINGFAEKNVSWTQCNGFWRGALVVDFHKDIPAFARDLHLLPSAQFVRELSDAFRGPLVQMGEFN